MNAESSQLPWNDLQHVEGNIPWPALRAFAEAVPNDPDVIHRLFEVYDRAYAVVPDEIRYADLYVPAIFALAAGKLSDDQRREIGAFLLTRLSQAGQDDADLNLETLTASAGTLGPAILPLVLDTIKSEPDTRGAWVFLWSLTTLSAKTNDPALREPVIRACADLMERADRDEIDPMDAEQAAWTAALLIRTECTDLLERLARKPRSFPMLDEYGEALRLLQGRLDYTPPPQIWERPVEDWLEGDWRIARDWFAKRENYDDEPDELDEIEEDPDEIRARLLADGFTVSPVARSLPPELLEDADFVVNRETYYSRTFVGADPTEWDEPSLRELLLNVLPRKITGDAELFAKIGPVTEAFLTWLGVEGYLEAAPALAATVRGWSEQIVAAGMDPQNWGPAKTFVMQAEQNGVDIFDPGALEAYLDEQRREFLAHEPFTDEPEPADYQPPIPIVEHAPKIGRNDPCPCGSGKKYKKCCGNPTKNQADK